MLRCHGANGGLMLLHQGERTARCVLLLLLLGLLAVVVQLRVRSKECKGSATGPVAATSSGRDCWAAVGCGASCSMHSEDRPW